MKLKTPITYYGGKQKMLTHILPRLPEHNVYIEPFCGGAAVFWAKNPCAIEVLNDINGEIVNFYIQVKKNPEKLEKLIQSTPISRRSFEFANIVYLYPEFFSPVRRAWAVWNITTQGFASKIGHGWGYCTVPSKKEKKDDIQALKVQNKKKIFSLKDESGAYLLAKRLETVQLENIDAIKLIQARNRPECFFYIDPPYPETNQGHYKGYNMDDFEQLLQTLVQIKGKFMLSCFWNKTIEKYANEYDWIVETFNQPLSAKKTLLGQKRKTKTECIIRNYNLTDVEKKIPTKTSLPFINIKD